MALGMDIPTPRKPRTMMLGQLGSYLEPSRPLGNGIVDSEEFDFSDVFGPVNPPPAHTGLTLTPVVEGKDDARWPSPEVKFSQDPAVKYMRSHSLVGPSPRPSFSRQNSRRAWDDLDNGCTREVGDSSMPPCCREASLIQDGSSPRVCGFSDLTLSDCSDSGSDKGTEDQDEGGAEQVASVQGSCSGKLGPQDFELLRVVGKGAFGKVFQVQKKETDEIYAMKVMRKESIMEKNHGDYMKAERDILTKVVHPFIVQLQYSFQTRTKLYLILDFINGGHLFFQLYRQGCFSEEVTKMYTAEIVCAVAHLHENGIIHRDLKPENILLDAEGHVKLTDFGLAKEVDDTKKSNSLCGTVEYMAPEIILAKGHGKAADWWSVGVLLYEMLTGKPPFLHENRQKLQQKIIKEKFRVPTYFTSDAASLVKGLLQKDPSKRVGSGPKGADEIKQHKWFKSINWRKLSARELQPKFRPVVNGMQCTANFDEMWTKMPLQDSPASTPKGGDVDFFQGYTYIAPNPWLSGDDPIDP